LLRLTRTHTYINKHTHTNWFILTRNNDDNLGHPTTAAAAYVMENGLFINPIRPPMRKESQDFYARLSEEVLPDSPVHTTGIIYPLLDETVV